MNDLMLAAIAAGTAAALLAVLLVLMRARKDSSGFAENGRAPPKKRTEGLCGICFGAVSKEDILARCGCGQAFHDACAEPVGACPYCKAPYEELVRDTPDCVTCPSCGADVAGSVCGCGAVVNRDGTFTCGCGNALSVSDPVCGRCGTEYDVCKGRDRR
ncbi:MAG: hypothetical protein FWD81_01135 [Methanomassiliicoccaceae archaeon]|nr:hypothetical protein [Methanomassiliicoccaceae archaeon]